MKPEDIKEIWVLRAKLGHAVPAIDDSDGLDLLAYASEEDAIKGAAHQNTNYDCNCVPVKIFPKD